MEKEFKPIPGFPNHEISDDGIIRRCVAGMTRPKGWIVGATKNNKGYLRVKITYNKKKFNKLVHDLVLISWKGLPQEGQVCRHLDGNPLNNHVSNLCWGTQKENINDRRLHGRSFDGERNPRAKLTKEQVLQMREEFIPNKFGEFARLSRKYNVAHSQVLEIIKRQSWSDN